VERGSRRVVGEQPLVGGKCFLMDVDPRTCLNKFQQEFLLFPRFRGGIHLKNSLCLKEQQK